DPRGWWAALNACVAPAACFNDILPPPAKMLMRRNFVKHCPHRHTVYDAWGMGGKNTRGRGLCALYTGESGTGKTLAAEAIANEGGLDLYRINLANVVRQSIGQTVKNVRRTLRSSSVRGRRPLC